MGYTQEVLAEMCDLSPRYISNIENGSGNISIDTIEKIADNLNVNSHLLFIENKHNLAKRVNMKLKDDGKE